MKVFVALRLLWCSLFLFLFVRFYIDPENAGSNIFFWITFALVSFILFLHSLAVEYARQKGKLLRESGSDEVHWVETEDRWRIALFRYKSKTATQRNHPVLMVHGLSSNRLVFDIDENYSIARYLSRAGYDVWLLEMRGSNMSHHLEPSKKNHHYDFDDLLLTDIPCAIRYVLNTSAPNGVKSKSLHYIGHSMGGILLLSHLGMNPEHFAKIKSVVTVGRMHQSIEYIGSAMIYHGSGSGYEDMLPLKKYAHLLKNIIIPSGVLNALISSFITKFPNGIMKFQIHRANTPDKVAYKIFRFALHSIPAKLLIHLSTAVDNPKGIMDRENKFHYIERLKESCKAASSFLPPLLMIGGDLDLQCPPKAVLNTSQELASVYPNLKTKMFGKQYGQKFPYGHFDLLVGKEVQNEVFPVIEKWLNEAD